MDDKRFDALVRSIGKGASRRSILKGLLGLGWTAVAGGAILSDSDARTVGTRPRIPPPPTRTPTPVPTTTPAPTPTPDPCPAPNFRCGLDCCADELQCCDGECCPEGTACLTKAFYGESPSVEEETCCDLDQTCDGQCCLGTCFWPLPGQVGAATVLEIFDRECCPAETTFCAGQGQFSAFGLCCSGDTEHCCHEADGRPACVAGDECCVDADCGECEACDAGQCLSTCAGFENAICCNDQCVDGECCDDQDCVDGGHGDFGCVTCYNFENQQGQPASSCVLLGSEETEFNCGTSGFCCYGECLDATTPCILPCSDLGEICTTNPFGCCQPLRCDQATGVCVQDEPPCDPACQAPLVCCDGTCQTCCAGTGIGCEEFENSICCFGEYCRTAGNICCRIDGDCPTGSVCCGGTCDEGECCTGIADDGRCGLDSICCPGPNGNVCVDGTTCEPVCDPVTCGRCETCYQGLCVTVADETGCVRDNQAPGVCCSGICVAGDSCETTGCSGFLESCATQQCCLGLTCHPQFNECIECLQDADCDPPPPEFCETVCDFNVCTPRNCIDSQEICCVDGCRLSALYFSCPIDPELCCIGGSQCCVEDGCCNQSCYGGPSGFHFCCPLGSRICPDGTTCVLEGNCCTDCSELNVPQDCLEGFCDGGGCQQRDTCATNCCSGACLTNTQCCIDSDCDQEPACMGGGCTCDDGSCVS